SQNRKQDIEKRLSEIAAELTKAEPELKILKVEVDERQKQLADFQAAYQELNEIVQEKSTAYNQENIRLHQQQNKVAGIQKDLEYRESQKEALELLINKNNAVKEQIKVDMINGLKLKENINAWLKEIY